MIEQHFSASRDGARWREAVLAFGPTDPCFFPDYHRMHERNGDGEAVAFSLWDAASGQRFFYCSLKRPVPKSIAPASRGWHDMQTVYGYSGPLMSASDPHFIDEAWSRYRRWCADAGVIAEFIRFQPWLENHKQMPADVKVRFDRQTVVLDIPETPEALWASYRSTQQKNVKIAQNAGVTCEVVSPEEFPTFVEQYLATMRRNEAGPYYYYSEEYFNGLRSLLGTDAELFAAYHEGNMVGTAVMCLARPYMQYHLSGAAENSQNLRVHNIILHTAALWGQARGYRRMQLGGGRTSSPDDSLLWFKGTISRGRLDYYTGTWVHEPEAYNSCCSEWMRQSGVDALPDYFLAYRRPVVRPDSATKAA